VIPLLDLTLPIEPGAGVAGLRIGTHVSEYAEVLRGGNVEYGGAKVVGIWAVHYRLDQAYETTLEDLEEIRAAFDEIRRARLRNEPVPDLGELTTRRPELPSSVGIGVDVRDGIVFTLSALEGYEGRLFDKIRVGMTFAEARAQEPRLHYDQLRDEARVEGFQGLELVLDDADPEEEYLDETTIEEICVFLPERGPTLPS
jgi:hypothetical protein